jgi:hypothetical protein
MSKNFERAEIQGPVNEAVNNKLKELGVEPSPDHTRRTIRAMLHTCGKMMLEAGGSASDFRKLAEECIGKEKTCTDYKNAGESTDVTVEFTSPVANRLDKRFLGGKVQFSARQVKTNLPIFSYVEERGSARFVRDGSPLDIALRVKLGAACIGGGSPIMVVSAKDANDFTIEYTSGYVSA